MSGNGNEKEQITLTIDGQELTVDKGTNVLEAAAQIGIEIPYFCWHPKLDSVGACRMCLVDVEKIPKPAVSCATEVMPGMVVKTATDEIIKARRGVLEFILLNHPLDCPTCDKGGECDLQDNVFNFGIDKSRQTFTRKRVIDTQTKTTFDDKRIGPEVWRNMNRCVTCFKCTRFNKEIAGEWDLGAFQRGSSTVIDAPPGEQIDNLYSGNVVEICPVGALTNNDWRYKIRNWKATKADSICSHDADGQNITLWYDHRQLFRATSRPNDAIDDGWICNIARYGYQYINSPDRLTKPLIKKGGTQVEATWPEAIELIAKKFSKIKGDKGSVCIAGLLGGNQSNETAYLFNQLFRSVLHSNSVDYRLEYTGLTDGEHSEAYNCLYDAPFQISSLETADCVLIYGSNLIKDHPAVNLRLRKAYRKNDAKVYTANPVETKSGDISTDELIYNPDCGTAFLVALTHALIDGKLYKNIDEAKAAEIKSLLEPSNLNEAATRCGIEVDRINYLASDLAGAKNLFILGGDYLRASSDRSRQANALYNLANLLDIPDSNSAILASQANSKGARFLGLSPQLPAKLAKTLADKWGTTLPESTGCNTSEILKGALEEEIDAVFVMGANPGMRYPDGPFVDAALDKLDFLVVADLFETATSLKADVVLPLAGWSEADGSYVNLSGMYQKFSRALKPKAGIKAGTEILQLLMTAIDPQLKFDLSSLSQNTRDVIDSWAIPQRDKEKFFPVKQAHIVDHEAFPYRLLIGNDLHHYGYLTEHCPSLMKFASEPYVELSTQLAEKLGIDDGDLLRIESTSGKLVLKSKISEFFEGDVIFIPNNFSAVDVNCLVSKETGGWVKIEKLDDK